MPSTTEIIPKTYNNVLQSTHKQDWLKAMGNKLQSLRDNNVFEETYKYVPKFSTVSSRWVYALKNLDSKPLYEARLVDKGFFTRKRHKFLFNLFSGLFP